MSKPWDHLRKPVKTPFNPGVWNTTASQAKVRITSLGRKYLSLGVGDHNFTQVFYLPDLTELIEFLEELREQLEP